MRDEAAALLNFWAFLKSLEGRLATVTDKFI